MRYVWDGRVDRDRRVIERWTKKQRTLDPDAPQSQHRTEYVPPKDRKSSITVLAHSKQGLPPEVHLQRGERIFWGQRVQLFGIASSIIDRRSQLQAAELKCCCCGAIMGGDGDTIGRGARGMRA